MRTLAIVGIRIAALLHRTALLLACAGLGISAASRAAEQPAGAARLSFAIPPQSLSTALIAFGKQANVQVLTAGGLVADLESRGVQGSFDVAAALARLLQGTGFGFQFIDRGTIAVKPLSTTPPAPGGSPAGEPAAGAEVLAPVRAFGRYDRSGYLVASSNGATRIETDLTDVPLSIGVVTHDLMDSQQARTVAEAARNVSGVQYFDGSIGLPIFEVRGFLTGNGMTDGMPNSIAGVGDYPPLVGVERVEVLKGPQAILGDVAFQNNFGGLVNVVLKKPQAEPVRDLVYSVGEHGDQQLAFDLAGPLNMSRTLSYRLVLSAEHIDHTAQGYLGTRRAYVAPSVGWNDENTSLIVGAAHNANREPIPDHVMLLGGTLASASPDNLLLGNPGDHSRFTSNRFFYLLEHAFGDTWTFRSRAQYVRETAGVQDWLLDSPDPSGNVQATAERYRYTDAFYNLQNDIVGTFGHGSVQHTLFAGLDFSRARVGSIDEALATIGDGSYNLFSGLPLPPVGSVIKPGDNAHESADNWVNDAGLLVQDQIKLGEHWDALLALRRTTYQVSTTHEDGSPWVRHDAHWVRNIGVVDKLANGISVYASATSGFQPDTALGRGGTPLPPSLSRQVEVGARFDLFEGRARVTVSGYRILLDHSIDLVSPKPPYFSIPGPGQNNRGAEVELGGSLAPGLDVNANYTWSRVHNDDDSLATGVPRQRFRVWLSYWLGGTAQRGWGIAGGIHGRSRTHGLTTDGEEFDNPGQVGFDANVSYAAVGWRMTLGVRNLFDRRLLADDFDETFVPLQERRTVLLSGTYAF